MSYKINPKRKKMSLASLANFESNFFPKRAQNFDDFSGYF